ncbi:hypothetical protein DSCO28_22880 [Desulfosarcina ovata subsp. sediminis]|uniref:Uncharacterized protein n=1 Tax=Desulfosarcina ovata subsp. sediminis TaxID=885957 RepID=A0A5K7ZHY5_9BACT|nr:hypothetical protein [Desulfosarcina ovata]BBO81722.1 hypothetical protein DSCO28_22880 [Desulfosarcina ovata subsp. sediminis]
MPDPNNPNLLMLEMAAEKLGPLVDVVVFLGGCATGLLITEKGEATGADWRRPFAQRRRLGRAQTRASDEGASQGR